MAFNGFFVIDFDFYNKFSKHKLKLWDFKENNSDQSWVNNFKFITGEHSYYFQFYISFVLKIQFFMWNLILFHMCINRL